MIISVYCEHRMDDYDKDRTECINFAEFEDEFFESPMFKKRQTMTKEQADYKTIRVKIESAGSKDIAATMTKHRPHQFDQIINGAARKRKRRLLALFLGGLAAGIVIGVIIANASRKRRFDENSLVKILGKGSRKISDVNIGDFVHDGTEYSKVTAVNRYISKVEMNQIKFGNPENDNSLTLSPEHLYMTMDGECLLQSKDIRVGDILRGADSFW
eukprot:TRINITY_DN7423_c0_g1_i1.p1 TRINITY_DN7423_c0_g1~~TRINITY_DN7423_c0_g1_i1.p1  ORF type:complete len:215 (+),score=26.03 TRINITY_DN7423_c0_g1_i1:83-727(+)